MPAAIRARVTRPNGQVCDRFHGGLTAKRLAVFCSAKRRSWPFATFRGAEEFGRYRARADIGRYRARGDIAGLAAGSTRSRMTRTGSRALSFNHLVGGRKQRRRHGEAESECRRHGEPMLRWLPMTATSASGEFILRSRSRVRPDLGASTNRPRSKPKALGHRPIDARFPRDKGTPAES
jgi:hypothetical protein